MYRYLFNRFKKIIPKISETEIIALRSGGTSIDREIFRGKIDYKKLFEIPLRNNDLPIDIDNNINKLLKIKMNYII